VSGAMRARQAAFFPGPAQCLCLFCANAAGMAQIF
jgi:hypothetical protein